MKNIKFALPLIASLFIGCNDTEKIENSNTQVQQEQESLNKKVSNSLVTSQKYVLQTIENGTFTVVKNGTNFSVQNSDATLVLYDFFTTWCPSCRAVSPHLSNLQAKYPKELLVMGVLVEENQDAKNVKKFKLAHKADYPISISTTRKNNFANFHLSSEIASLLRQPRSFPIPLLVMFKNGKYFRHYIGAVPEEMIESDIKEALKLRGQQ